MALPNSNLEIDMVRGALGAATNNVGQLCIHPNVNKWSKWKPVRHSSVTPLSFENLVEVHFGMIPTTIGISDIPDNHDDEFSSFIWGQYQKPYGTEFSPYRLTDFNNYNHKANSIIDLIVFKNSAGGNKPIVGNPAFPNNKPYYSVILYYNFDADIKLTDFKINGINVSDMYLTLVIGTNVNGLSPRIYAQSTQSIGESYSHGDSSVTIDTYNLYLEKPENIVFAYLTTKIDSIGELDTGVSLKLDNTITTTLYFDNFATYGDGGEGGGSTTLRVEGLWSWEGGNPYIEDYIMYFNTFKYIMTQRGSAKGELVLEIEEMDAEFIISRRWDIDFLAVEEQSIDISDFILPLDIPINPSTGELYTNIRCRFYIDSTAGVDADFNEISLIIPVN